MFWAADKDCRQVDITTDKLAGRIARYLEDHIDEFVWKGEVMHLPLSEGSWDLLFKPCEEGTYQNSAYWATPLAWIIPVLAGANPGLARELLGTVINDFQENGIHECINDGYMKVPDFVVSATSVCSLTR